MTSDTEMTTHDAALLAQDARARMRNNVRKLREQRLMSKAELARKAGLSALTVDRIEHGKPCRMDTKRKIILALGMRIEDKDDVFVPEENPEGEPDGTNDVVTRAGAISNDEASRPS